MTIFKSARVLAAGFVAAATLNLALAAAAESFNLSPDNAARVRAEKSEAVVNAISPDFKFVAPDKFTVAIFPWDPPIATYATDGKTIVGSDPDIAQLLADKLGRELDVVPVAWPDWPLGLSSGRFDAVIANVAITEERKEKFDFSSYRRDYLGFYVKADSKITNISEPKDIAGLRIITMSGTSQEKVLLEWDKQNVAAGLKPIEIQYYDDPAASALAIQSGRADVEFNANATLAYASGIKGDTRLVGTISGGWPVASANGITTRRGSGIAKAITLGLNELLESGKYGEVLNYWKLESEAIDHSETNPLGLPKTN